MQRIAGTTVYSATDLANFLATEGKASPVALDHPEVVGAMASVSSRIDRARAGNEPRVPFAQVPQRFHSGNHDLHDLTSRQGASR